MTAPVHLLVLRSDQHPLETLHEGLLLLHLDEIWLRLCPLEKVAWGSGHCLQLELYHLRDGSPLLPEGAGAMLSARDREMLRLSMDGTRTSVAYELFRNGQSVAGWAGDVESFGSEDHRPKKERKSSDLAACRDLFLQHFRKQTGLDFEELTGALVLSEEASQVAQPDGLLLLRGRLLKPVEGMGRWPELFRFHDRNEGEKGEDHVALVGLDLQLTERLWRRSPASQVYQYLRMLEPLRQIVLGPLGSLLPEVLGVVEAHPPEQPLASAAEPDLTVYEVLAMSTALIYMVGDRVRYLDERFYPLLAPAGAISAEAVRTSLDEIEGLGILSAITEVVPYSVPEGEMMESFADEELSPLAAWGVHEDSYEGSLFLLDSKRLLGLVEAFDVERLQERLAEFRQLWDSVARPDGEALEDRAELDAAELSRFEDTFVELQHTLALAQSNGLTPALLFYS